MQETLAVPDISCDHCKRAVEEALGPLDGVNSATVRVAEKCVDVDYDPDVIERDQIFHSLQEAGYPATR